MLQKLNERFQGIVAWVVISIVAVTFTLFGIEYYIQSKQTSEHVLLEVNGSPITKEMLRLKIERARRFSANPDTFDQNEGRFLQELVRHEIALQSARNNGFYVSLADAQAALFQLPQFAENGRFSAIRYREILSNALYSNEQFQQELQQDMLIQQERFAFLATDFVLPSELKRYIKSSNESRKYRYIEIPADHFISQVTVNDADMNAYYEAHSNEFMTPEAVRLSYIELSLPRVKSKLTLTDEELRQYYRENHDGFSAEEKSFDDVKSTIRTELIADKAQIEYARLLDALSDMSYQNPTELESTAKALGLEVKQTELFTKNGGHSALTKNPQVIQLAFSEALLISGENSAPLQLDPETVLVCRVSAHHPSQKRSFTEVKSQIRDMLMQQQSLEAALKLSQSFQQAKSSEWSHIMQQNQLVWRQGDFTTQEQANASNPIAELAFRIQAPGEILSEQLTLNNGNKIYVVLQLEEIVPGKLKALTTEKKNLIKDSLISTYALSYYESYLRYKTTHSSVKTA